MTDYRVKLHNEVANTIEIPNTTTEFVIVVHNFHRANWPIKPSDVKLFTLEKSLDIAAFTEIYQQDIGKKCVFRDGRDYLAKETKLEALNYSNDGLITLQAFPAAESRSMEKLLRKRSICPTLAEGGTGKLPLDEKEKEQILFATAPLSTSIARLQAKFPDGRFTATMENGHRRFQCHDCPTKTFRDNISVSSMAKHLEDNDHQTLVEARLIRESAAPEATKHKRMLVFPPFFQDLLSQVFTTYPDDLLLPGWQMEWECDSDCSHDHTKMMLQPSGLNIRCLECPGNGDGEYKEWNLKEMHHSQDPRDKEWKKFVNHLHSARHRECVRKRLVVERILSSLAE